MNESDDHIDSDGDGHNAETPLETLEQSLAGRVAAALAVLAEAQAEAEKAGPGAVARVVALYGDRFASAMEDFGEALADALGSSPATLDLGPLLAMSRDLPVFRRAQQVVAKKEADPELQMVLLRGRGAAFDAPSLLLDRYYQESVSARSLRSRVVALGELLTEEVCARVARGQNEVRLLHLQSGSLAELDAVLDHPVCSAHLAITFVDGSTPALRGSRQRVV